MQKNPKKDAEYLIDLATKLGADHAVHFNITNIVFDPHTILKWLLQKNLWVSIGWGNAPRL